MEKHKITTNKYFVFEIIIQHRQNQFLSVLTVQNISLKICHIATNFPSQCQTLKMYQNAGC